MESDSEEDLKERDKFVERLKKRDESNKRNIVSRSGIFLFVLKCNITMN